MSSSATAATSDIQITHTQSSYKKNRLSLQVLLQVIHADARHYQLTMLTALLTLGCTLYHLPITWQHILYTLVSACITQWIGHHFFLPTHTNHHSVHPPINVRVDFRSALITSASLCLLLRVSHPLWMIPAAVLAIGSKFLIRWKSRHLFNPANIAITALIILTGQAWLSPGQWGNTLLIFGLLWAVGGWIIFRAQRSDTTLSFLVAYMALLLTRSIWLGDPLAIPLHQFQNGALLIFAFLMISDPKTTPNHSTHRILFGILVAILTVIIQWNWFRPDALMLALSLASLSVPLLNHIYHTHILPSTPSSFAS